MEIEGKGVERNWETGGCSRGTDDGVEKEEKGRRKEDGGERGVVRVVEGCDRGLRGKEKGGGWKEEREKERMHKHTSQLRGPGSGHHVANRGPVRRWNSFHGGGSVGGGASNFNDTVGNGNLPPGMITKAPQEPFRAVPKAVQALRSESVDRSHRAQPPPPPAFPRRRFSVWWVWKFEFRTRTLVSLGIVTLFFHFS